MILNTATVLTLVLAVASVGVAVTGLGVVLKVFGSGSNGLSGDRLIRRDRLLVLLGILSLQVLVTRFLSWPCVLMALRSMAPEVRGAMCGFGVLRSTPNLAWLLVATKLGAALLLLSGFVLTRADQATRSAALLRPRLCVVSLALLVSAGDAVVDGSFLLAERETIEVSCCSSVLDVQERWSQSFPEAVLGTNSQGVLLGAFFGLAIGVAVVSLLIRRKVRTSSFARGAVVGLGALCGLLLFPAGVLVAMEWLSPIVLHLPHHHCPLEVWTETADGAVMLMLLVLGSGLPIASFVLVGAARSRMSEQEPRQVLESVLGVAALAALGVAVMVATHGIVAEVVP